MKLKNKIVAGLAGAALVLGGTVVSAPAANAAYGNVVRNTVNRCTLYVPQGWSVTSSIKFCGAGFQASSVAALRIPAGQCLEVGYWSFTRYCAPSSNYRLIYLGSGTYFVR